MVKAEYGTFRMTGIEGVEATCGCYYSDWVGGELVKYCDIYVTDEDYATDILEKRVNSLTGENWWYGNRVELTTASEFLLSVGYSQEDIEEFNRLAIVRR